MQEHVGKKRRKEVREALNMRQELNKYMTIMVVTLVIGIIAWSALSYLMVTGVIPNDTTFMQTLPYVLLFIVIIFIGSRSYKWSALHERYRKHCVRYNITKSDIKALKNGEM